MKKILFLLVVMASVLFFSGCSKEDGGYDIPTKTGGGGQQQPYVPAGNKNGGQFMHAEPK